MVQNQKTWVEEKGRSEIMRPNIKATEVISQLTSYVPVIYILKETFVPKNRNKYKADEC